MIDVDKYLSELIKAELTVEEREYFDKNVALIEPSIGRMVPATPEEIAKREMLAVCVEPYCELPVDRAAFKGEMPKIVNMRPFSPFEFHIRRKLFMHNMSHALTAYLGNLKGYTYIWEASGDFEIRKIALRALGEVSYAMSREYGVAESELVTFGVELMERYDNKLLGDTVFRVGRDTKRKLSENDRFVGAIRLCEKHGGMPKSILLGIAAGLHFAPEGDGASAEIAANIAEKGIADTLERFCGIDRSSAAVGFVENAYSTLGKMAQNASFAEILAELGIEI
jgi:mannitol-1-phosphate 5-dehydrogenase